MRHLLIVIFLLVVSPSFCQLSGKVIAVADGDTFTLLTATKKQIKIRLHGIDCPERKQDFGNAAKKFLTDLIFNKAVDVKEMNIDRYGRTIGIVRIDSTNINE
ncbi:MAG TPA: thermonuclease family protein, partial [Cyclobacteriaceae bacterium]